jgi:hypothetical protein
LIRYLEHVDSYYVKGGKPTTEPANIRYATRPSQRYHTRARTL